MLQILIQRPELADHPSLLLPALGLFLLFFTFALLAKH